MRSSRLFRALWTKKLSTEKVERVMDEGLSADLIGMLVWTMMLRLVATSKAQS